MPEYKPLITGKGRTQRNFKDQMNINKIVAKAQKAGGLPPNNRVPQYIDTTNIPDYQSAMNIVIQAETMFQNLPARIRDRFQNNPARMLEFVRDPNNYEEALLYGIVEKASKAAPTTTTPTENATPAVVEGSTNTGSPVG